MIAASLVRKVRKLLAGGKLSQRKIALITGVSRASIAAIASGKRPDRPAPRPKPLQEPPRPAGPPQRCPGCGGMVSMPCRACLSRAWKARRTKPSILAGMATLDEPLGMNLRGGQRRRYEELLVRKLAATFENSTIEPVEASEPDDEHYELDPADLLNALEPEYDERPLVEYEN